jgi:ligand-binding sensor domain-containing protein/serine phosphatase RsbU (regulator of sigma subunit)
MTKILILNNQKKIIRFVKRIIFFWLASVLFIPLKAQTYFFDNYSVAEGIAQSKIYTLLQDTERYIWMGTMNGLTRFDGVKFTNYTMQDGLSGGAVRALYQGRSGNIWIGHAGGGITRYDGHKFVKFALSSIFFHSDITSFVEDSTGRLWITSASSGAVVLQNPDVPVQAVRYEQYKGKRLSDRIFGSLYSREHKLYFITDVGIKEFDSDNNSFRNYNPDGLTHYFAKTSMFEDSRGNKWFGTYHGGLYKYDAARDTFIIYDTRDGLSSNWISTITEDHNGTIWAGTWGGGITCFNPDGSMQVYNTGNGLQDDKIWCMVEDREGNMLIGTNEHGLSIYKGKRFVSYGFGNSAENRNIHTVIQDDAGRFWFGSNDGVSVVSFNGDNPERTIHYNQQNKNIGNQVRFIRKDKNGNLWLGTDGDGIFMYNNNQDRFIYKFSLNRLLYRDNIVTAMVIDDHDHLWAGTNEGLVYYEIQQEKGQRLTQIHGLAGSAISSLLVDHEGIIWVGSEGKGLTSIHDTIFTRYNPGAVQTPVTLAEDKQHNILIGTNSQGLLVFNRDSVIKTYTTDDGLLSNLISTITVDKDNNYYIGTNKGLNKIITGEDRIISYTEHSGYTGIETKANASFMDSSGELWLGTVSGVTRYNPMAGEKSDQPPYLRIIDMSVNLEDHEMPAGLVLSYKENRIMFEYIAVDYTNPEAIRYQVMLEGADDHWQPVTTQRTASYASLSPGKYTFRVKAENYLGIWSKNPATFTFRIKPPYYQAWWFILLCIIAGSATLFIYIKLRERNLVKEKRVLEEKVRERTQEVVQKNDELAMKNKDITASIRYAKRIQVALLPPEIPRKDMFVLFKPKDIVSGDFYWVLEDETREYIAAVDCTGHGVPGAFMSIIGYNSLNKIVREYGITKPSEILNYLNGEVSKALHHKSDGTVVNDGMDIALVCYHKDRHLLEFAGAFNPVYIIHDGELTEIRGNRFSIGRSVVENNFFNNHEVTVKPGDIIYLFSDGYVDQFGGPDGKKFKPRTFKELLTSIHLKPLEDQQNILNDTIEEWMGSEYDQIDDILVMGRRFSG